MKPIRGPILALALLAPLLSAGVPAVRAQEPNEFDPASFDSLLSLYVHDGAVDYPAWKEAGTGALDAFLATATGYDLTATLAKEPKAAFLTNVYNAWVIRQVLEHYPVESVRDIPGFFDENRLLVAGEERTLSDIDELLSVLLAYLPSYSFLLAPGAAGGPPVPPRALTAQNYQEVLNQNTWAYVKSGHTLWFDTPNRILHVPPAIGDHLALYDNLEGGLGGFAGSYMSLSEAVALGGGDFEVVVDEMDWGLNDASEAADPPRSEETPPPAGGGKPGG